MSLGHHCHSQHLLPLPRLQWQLHHQFLKRPSQTFGNFGGSSRIIFTCQDFTVITCVPPWTHICGWIYVMRSPDSDVKRLQTYPCSQWRDVTQDNNQLWTAKWCAVEEGKASVWSNYCSLELWACVGTRQWSIFEKYPQVHAELAI